MTGPLDRARAALGDGLTHWRGDGAALQPGPAAIVSPMCQAVDWSCWRVEDAQLFLKLREQDAMPFVDLQATAAATQAASDLGLSPAVRFVLPDHGAIALDLLPASWRTARLQDLADPGTFAAVLQAKQAFRNGPPLRRQWDVFAHAAAMGDAVDGAGPGAGPDDQAALMAAVMQAREALAAAGQDARPCHADGLASNVMLGPGGAVMLVDFDCAGMSDPHLDVGVLLNEAYGSEAEMRPGLDLAFGRDDPRDLNRCRLLAFADDVVWGLWGLAMSATSPRRELEFMKYGEWRLLRARMMKGDGAFDARLRRL